MMYHDIESTDEQLWSEFYQFCICIGIMCAGAALVAYLI